MRIGIFIFSVLVYGWCALFSVLTNWEGLSVALFVFFFLDFLDNLGKKMAIFDITILLAIFTCLVMPAIFYHVYTKENRLAKIWIKYMFVPTDEYFSFAFPAVGMLILGFLVPLGRPHINKDPAVYMAKMKEDLLTKHRVGMILIGIGFVAGIFTKFVPEAFTQFFFFLDHLIYVGVFYVIYSPSKHKKKIVPLVLAAMVGESIAIGMFGDLIYILAVSLILILLGKKISFWKKLSIAVCGIYFIMLIQSIKVDYRREAWRGGGGGPLYFVQLLGTRIVDPATMYNDKANFLISVRMNQGWLVSVTMYYVPRKYSFANGETIWQSVAAAIVPRIVWPDKPEAGGKANLKRFWGYNLVGYSMNIGPMGEAYGNFGTYGGIVYMFFYGLLFNFLLSRLLSVANKIPTLILWVPFLFSGIVTVETDLLTTMGDLLKGFLFTWIMFKAVKSIWHLDL
jgi:hypothetical protein